MRHGDIGAVVKSCSSMLVFNIGHCLAHCGVKPDVWRPWYTRTATVVQAVRRPWYDRVAAAIQAEESRKGNALPEGRGRVEWRKTRIAGLKARKMPGRRRPLLFRIAPTNRAENETKPCLFMLSDMIVCRFKGNKVTALGVSKMRGAAELHAKIFISRAGNAIPCRDIKKTKGLRIAEA